MNFYELLLNRGQPSGEGMTHFERLFAAKLAGGGEMQTLTGQPPLSFKSDGTPLISWSMLGNTKQTGTPSPQNIIMPDFCGTLDGTDWKIPITCAGQTVPVHLGQVSTVRKIRKLVLMGNENITMPATSSFQLLGVIQWGSTSGFCTHYQQISWDEATYVSKDGFSLRAVSGGADRFRICDRSITTVADFRAYLAQQYANGTPVTIWYVLADPETAIVNEPLAKIGDYADELHSSDTTVGIPTVKGQNMLTVDTELPPSEMTITFKS